MYTGLPLKLATLEASHQERVLPLDLESQLRKLRQTSANLEEENALLSRHVENMKTAVEKVQKEVQKQEEKNENLQGHLGVLREVLAATFKDVPLPGE